MMNSSTQVDSTDPNSLSSLEPFYQHLLKRQFPTSATAIEYCRELCAQFGFTVKQESSTHRNIYVYCSREGLPDSLRNPKKSPKRKRPSKRCDCRWRVVLHEDKETHDWRFRKSNNPEASRHNHPLMRPEEIEKGWPKEVLDAIRELAQERLTTPEIRAQIQQRFPDISWNERRFYNRLSEERQKIRRRETVQRAYQLTTLYSKVCMAAAGCEELTDFAYQHTKRLLQTICNMAHISTESLDALGPTLENKDKSESQGDGNNNNSSNMTLDPALERQQQQPNNWSDPDTLRRFSFPGSHVDTSSRKFERRPSSWTVTSSETKAQDVPKGYIAVVIPEHTYFVKVHNQRTLNELQIRQQSIINNRGQEQEEEEEGEAVPEERARKQIKTEHTAYAFPHTSEQQQQQQMQQQFLPPQPKSMHPQQQQQQQQHNMMVSQQEAPMYYPPAYLSAPNHYSYTVAPTTPTGFATQTAGGMPYPPLDASSSTVGSTPSPVSISSHPLRSAYYPPPSSSSATTSSAPIAATTTATSSLAPSSTRRRSSCQVYFMPPKAEPGTTTMGIPMTTPGIQQQQQYQQQQQQTPSQQQLPVMANHQVYDSNQYWCQPGYTDHAA